MMFLSALYQIVLTCAAESVVWLLCVCSIGLLVGLCCLSFRKEIPPAVYIPQEEPEEEANGLLFIL